MEIDQESKDLAAEIRSLTGDSKILMIAVIAIVRSWEITRSEGERQFDRVAAKRKFNSLSLEESQRLNLLLAERLDATAMAAWNLLGEASKWPGKARANLATKAALAKLLKDAKGQHRAMSSIFVEWKARKNAGLRFSATAFAHEMHLSHKQAVTVEAIKNAQTRWAKTYRPTS